VQNSWIEGASVSRVKDRIDRLVLWSKIYETSLVISWDGIW